MVSPHQEELTALAGDILDTIAREDAERSFKKTGRTVIKTTARKVQVEGIMPKPKTKRNTIMGIHPMKFLKEQEREVKI